ncbi:MAG: hypothetical protein K2H34_06695 [Lachnospiraceae bacterium]|nr:hypothetical protein [Lachnospiraceae bacterium]
MFGYVVVNKPELKIREFHEYQSYYCGLCRTLKQRWGIRGQISLSYDMTFLAILLSLLYEPVEEELAERCVAHPMEKHRARCNEMIVYAADMNLMLTWYKCRDDLKDEKRVVKGIYGISLGSGIDEIKNIYERQYRAVQDNMEKLAFLEGECCENIDNLSGCFGHLLEEIFVVKQDEWESCLRRMGFHMGKFVYLLDAYDDLEQDRKKGCFNPFLHRAEKEGFDEWIKEILTMTAVEFASAFERLPLVEHVDILRNIIYSGIWTRYGEVRKKRMEGNGGR